MKKLFILMIYLFSVAAAAQTCPASNQIFVLHDRGYDVVPPPGWRVILDQRTTRHRNVTFRIAAWGDHKHPIDNVRCYYFDTSYNDNIKLESIDFLDRSRLSSQWHGTQNDNLYASCGSASDNVNECVFS